ncbi:hypothetical protein Tco_1426131 [Tanacetum coccineum]
MTHSHPNRGFVPQAVLTRTGKINTAGAKVNTAVRPVNNVSSKPTVNHPRYISNAYKKGYLKVTRSVNKFLANKNSIFNKKVNTVRVKDTTTRDRVVVSENKGKWANAVKASTCWVWKAKNSSASNTFKKYSYIDARGREVGTPRYLSLVVPLKKVGDEAVYKDLSDRMERDATTASSLEAEQDSGSGPRCQDTILGDVDAQTRFETTSKQFNDPPLSKVNTFRNREDSMQLMELMTRCTKLSALVSSKELRDNVSIKIEKELVRIKFDDENCLLE